MKNQIKYLLFVLVSLLICSCSKDDAPTSPGGGTGTSSGTFGGEWTVDKVQLVSAPNTGSIFSVPMKQALVPFGEIDGSFAGYLDFSFSAETMSSLNVPFFNNLYISKSSFEGSTGYCIASSFASTALFKTIDEGLSWTLINIPFSSSNYPYTFFTLGANKVYTVYYSGSNYGLAKSENGGINWTQINSNLNFYCNEIQYLNDSLAFASSGSELFKSTNGGINWTSILIPGSPSGIRNIKFFSETEGILLTGYNQNSKFLRTNDGGLSWFEYLVSSQTDYISDVFFRNSNTGWISVHTENNSQILKTNNGGITWSILNSNMPTLKKIQFENENTGYGISSHFVFKTTNSGINWSMFYTSEMGYSLALQYINNKINVFAANGKLFRESGQTDTTKWIAKGQITNSIIKSITSAPNEIVTANGNYSTSSDNIYFTVSNYYSTHNDSGSGKYYFSSGYLYITLNLPNNEVWKIKLRRK